MEEAEPQVYKTVPDGSTSSVASSSLKTPVSAPIGRRHLEAIPSGHSINSYRSDYEKNKLQSESSGSRGRNKTMKQLQKEVERRSHLRSRPSYATGVLDQKDKKEDKEEKSLPFKALTDLLLQTAVLGINTTAKVTKPTISHVILPLFRDLWELYMPIRIQTWMKVLPTTLSNLGNLLWDTESGKVLGHKLNELQDDVIDMVSSNAARQCWIDFTVGLIKFIEALHTPEMKALLDQYAVSICRFVDVCSSGKAKQMWFDLSATLWALVEVGSDPLVVMTLAEGCAQICFALEEERATLRSWREKENAARRRRERDSRQMEMYPTDADVVSGREGVEKALMHNLGNDQEEETKKNDDIKSGPPSVIVQNTHILDGTTRDNTEQTPTLNPIDNADQDDESEITTEEIEDLQLQDKAANGENWIRLDSTGQKIVYEQGDGDSTPDVASQHDNTDDEPDMADVFQESILQFHRRLNEVLDETRKGSKLSEVIEQKLLKENKLKHESPVKATYQEVKPQHEGTTTIGRIHRSLVVNRWKIFIVGAICFAATIILTWFALGCYGFYVIFLGGGQLVHFNAPSMHQQLVQQQSHEVAQQPIIIQVKVGDNKASNNQLGNDSNFASMSLDEWKKMSRDVETAIRKQIDAGDEL